jgi:transposase
LHVKIHAANTHDTVAGCAVSEEALKKYAALKGVCADAGYGKTFKDFVENVLKKTIDISEPITPGWAVLAKRWIVERTFAWLNHFPRLLKDYEISTNTAENFVMIAHSIILIKKST